MLRRPGRFFRWMGRFFFDRVSFSPRFVEQIRDCSRDGTPIYIVQQHSLMDYLYFNWAFLKLALPLATFANAVNTLLFRRVLDMILFFFRYYFGKFLRLNKNSPEFLKRVAGGNLPALIFLRTPRQLKRAFFEDKTDYLRALIEQQRGQERPLFLIPQLLNWTLNPERVRRNVFDVIFGDPNRPGRLRKIAHFLYHHKRAFVQLCEPLNLKEFLAQHADLDDEKASEQLRFVLMQGFSLERKVIKGPVLKGARRLKEEILQNKELIQRIHEMAERDNTSAAELMRGAKQYLDEIAADYRQSYVEFLFLVLHPIWNRIYAGLETDAAGLERVKEAAKQAPIVLVPSHKSHMDYLLISYVFYLNGLIPPHIAAGDNLNFWPMGHIFRHSGAFFLRRRFAGLELYTLIFRHYLRKMIKEGFAIEFFIEGGRSRSGKILPPKFGMLRFLVEAVLSGASRDIYFVPVNIGYEKIVEERSLMRELQGGEKEQENIGDLFKTTRILNRKFGRLYAQFDEPISLREFFSRLGVGEEQPDEDTLQSAVTHLGHELVHCLSRISTATPSAVVALSMLSLGKRGAPREELLCRVGFIVGLLHERRARLSNSLSLPLVEAPAVFAATKSNVRPNFRHFAPIGALLEDVIDEVLHLFSNNRFISTYQDEDETLFRVEDGARINLDYYKNQVIEFFVDEAIVSTSFAISQDGGRAARELVRSESLALSKLLKLEFHFSTNTDFPTAFERTCERLVEHGILSVDGDELVASVNAEVGLTLFRNLIRGFIESYYVAALTAQRFLGGPMPEADFLARCQRHFQRLLLETAVSLDEGVSSANFQNALLVLEGKGALCRRAEKNEKGKTQKLVAPVEPLSEASARLQAVADGLKRYL